MRDLDCRGVRHLFESPQGPPQFLPSLTALMDATRNYFQARLSTVVHRLAAGATWSIFMQPDQIQWTAYLHNRNGQRWRRLPARPRQMSFR